MVIRLEMKNYKYQHYRQVKYEYLTGEEILPFNQRRRRTSKFAYSPFGKSIEKQTKNRLPLQSP